jgi:flavin-dependent dehydrogenase
MAKVREPARRTPVIREAEVVVLGGGPAGIATAVASARGGARTLLVERYGFLGGMGTAALVTSFCGLYANVHGEQRRVVRGIADELLARLAALDGLNVPQDFAGRIMVQSYDVAAYKCAADDLVLGAGVELLFHALAVGAVIEDGRIGALLVESKSGRGAVRGRVFVDCSGDADLAAWAGAPYAKGNAAGFLQLPTLMFRLGNVDGARAEAEGGAAAPRPPDGGADVGRVQLPAAIPRSCDPKGTRASGGRT